VNCDAAQERLDERALTRSLAVRDGTAAEFFAHVDGCEACGAHLAFLRALDAELAALPTAPVRASVVATAQQRAARALRAREQAHGFGRELAAALAVAVLALPFVVAQAFVVVESGAWLLASWLPHPILLGLGAAYLGSFALGVGALYGSIPLVVAWRRRALMEWA
jgi:anti-sigma factor RsiW